MACEIDDKDGEIDEYTRLMEWVGGEDGRDVLLLARKKLGSPLTLEEEKRVAQLKEEFESEPKPPQEDVGEELLKTFERIAATVETPPEPTPKKVADACREVLVEAGLEEMLEEIEGYEDSGEAVGIAFTALLEAGIEDPEAFLIEKGILQPE